VVCGFCAIMYFVGAKDFALWAYAKTWSQATCEIKLATYDRRWTGESVSGSGGSPSFTIITSYTFWDKNENQYRGNRFHFEPWPTGYKAFKKDKNYLTSSTHLPCYYSKNNPELSVIDRSFQLFFLFLLVPLLSIGPFAYISLRYLYANSVGKLLPQPRTKRFLP